MILPNHVWYHARVSGHLKAKTRLIESGHLADQVTCRIPILPFQGLQLEVLYHRERQVGVSLRAGLSAKRKPE